MWTCPKCGQEIEARLEACPKCAAEQGEAVDGHGSRDPVDGRVDPIMPPSASPCSHCGGTTLYVRRLSSAGGYGPHFLPGLGSFLRHADFDVVVCATCGLTRFFAEPSAREKVIRHVDWRRIDPPAARDEAP